MKLRNWIAIGLSTAALTACGGANNGVDDIVSPDDVVVPKGQEKQVAEKEFRTGLEALATYDRDNSWNEKRCEGTARKFLIAAELFKRVKKTDKHHLAHYNAALSLQRCKMSDKAKALLTQLLEIAPSFHRAKAQLALYRYAETGDIDTAISELNASIIAGEFKNIDALVGVAMLHMKRANKGDMGDAKLNLQRALALDDGHMPALNQLAIYYLRTASGAQASMVASASTSAAKNDVATLELAALVCSQAVRKNPRYAPIHNTAGLVSVQLGDLSAAASSFKRARALDPSFFEAHMNYAAVNLQFRGFIEAQKAYEKALELDKDSYDARLGLALALRGQIGKNPAKDKALLDRSHKLLTAAKKLNAKRPEAYFNEAILLQEFRIRGLAPAKAKPLLVKAKGLFGEFMKLAKNNPDLAQARSRAKQRMSDIQQQIDFFTQNP